VVEWQPLPISRRRVGPTGLFLPLPACVAPGVLKEQRLAAFVAPPNCTGFFHDRFIFIPVYLFVRLPQAGRIESVI
jgi:hypothetical protein